MAHRPFFKLSLAKQFYLHYINKLFQNKIFIKNAHFFYRLKGASLQFSFTDYTKPIHCLSKIYHTSSSVFPQIRQSLSSLMLSSCIILQNILVLFQQQSPFHKVFFSLLRHNRLVEQNTFYSTIFFNIFLNRNNLNFRHILIIMQHSFKIFFIFICHLLFLEYFICLIYALRQFKAI